MPIDDKSGPFINDYVLYPADLCQDTGQRILLSLGMDTPVFRVSEELGRIFLAVPDNAVTPLRKLRVFRYFALLFPFRHVTFTPNPARPYASPRYGHGKPRGPRK